MGTSGTAVSQGAVLGPERCESQGSGATSSLGHLHTGHRMAGAKTGRAAGQHRGLEDVGEWAEAAPGWTAATAWAPCPGAGMQDRLPSKSLW